MTTVSDPLSKAPLRKRSSIARGLAPVEENQIDRDGGKFGHGLIRGVSVITRGEALGHGMWIDSEFIASTAEHLNASERGIKARFTHPSLSSDGMGNYLGRFFDARVEGDRVLADLHFAEAGHKTKSGDMAEYVMGLAEEDPEAFGTSIVFSNDFDAIDDHVKDNGGDGLDPFGGVSGNYQSPDPLNTDNLPHARMLKLHATDVVDEPAANPNGFFHDLDSIAVQLDGYFGYVLCLSNDRPQDNPIGIDCDRARGFASRFLSAHGLAITPIQTESAMSEPEVTNETPEVTDAAEVAEVGTPEVEEVQDEATEPQAEEAAEPEVVAEAEEPEAIEEPIAASAPADGQKFLDTFGAQGGVWFAQGKTYDEAMALHVKAQAEEIADLKSRLAASPRGVDEPVQFDVTDEPQDDKSSKEFEKQVEMWMRDGTSREEAERKARKTLERRSKSNK